VRRHCTLELDLKNLPEGAFKLYKGSKGEFYQAKFDLALIFEGVVTLQLRYGNAMLQKQTADYVVTDTTYATSPTMGSRNSLAPENTTLVVDY